jgi:predicted extracellular nuclease
MKRMILGVALVATLAACGTDAESREDLASLAADGEVPSQPVRTNPAQSERAPPPAAPVRAIPAGTVLTFEVRENVSTSSHASGDAFNLVLVDAVSGPAEAVLAAGTPARGLVTEAHRSSGPEDESLLVVRVASIEAAGSQRAIEGQVQSTEIESSTRDSGARTAATIATGAAAGAIIGQVLGKDTRSTVTGAAVGTAVGVVVALTTRGGDSTLGQGSRIVVRLDRDLVF